MSANDGTPSTDNKQSTETAATQVEAEYVETQNSAEPAAADLPENHGDNEESANTAAANEEDKPEGSFVVLLDDEPASENETTVDSGATDESDEEEVADSDSFLILFDDDEPEDRTSIEEHNGNYKILLAGDISFHNIVKLKTRLESTFDAIGIEIDAKGVDGMDTSSAQMLLSYTNNLKNSSVPIKWLGTSKTFDNVSNTLGVSITD